MKLRWSLGVLWMLAGWGLVDCTATDIFSPELISFAAATPEQCAGGGTQVQNYIDSNGNGKLDSGEQVLSSSTICNGTNGQSGGPGQTGAQGNGAGVQLKAATGATCPGGGNILTTFIDANNSGVLDAGETVTSVSALCNGTNGRDGTDGAAGAAAHITVTIATNAQCAEGGAVYSTYADGQASAQTVICNGQNGSNAAFEIGAVGPAVDGKSYTACHHDYIYIPGTAGARGWLVFRHQQNGAADQGIGSTGFEVWDVDIADFNLVSEVGGVTYCQLHWDSSGKVLSFTVLDGSDALAGTTGTIQL